MQKTLIIIDTNTRSAISATGEALKYSSDYPVIERGQWQILCYQFYNKETDSEGLVTLNPVSFESNTSFVLVGDNNFQDDDSLMLKSLQSITPFSDADPVSNMFNIPGDWIDGSTADPALGQLSVRINSNTEKFKTVLGDAAKVLSGLYLNLKQYTVGVSAPSTIAWTNFAGYNTVRDWSSAQVVPPTGTEAISFINTYFRNPLERVYSVAYDGEYDSSYDSSQDLWYKERISNIGAEWSDPIPLTIPEKGDDGLSAYQVAVANGYTGTAVEWLESLKGEAGLSSYEIAVANGYTDTVEAWLMSLKGNNGDPGKSAYELAVDLGYSGTPEQWLDALKGEPGPAGQDLKFDAVGELTELDAYNDEPAGFTFASFVTDAETNLTTIYFYLKKSNATGDWFPAQLINFRNGVDGENVAIIPPAEFGARPTGTTYFAFAQANYPAAWISAVVIDTEEGELQLPYNSIAGVTKIVKQADKFYIHFGAGCPAFTSGRAYFAQGVTTLDIVPVDPPPAEGAVYYGYIPASVAGDTPKVSTITQAMLDDPASSIVTAEAVALDKTSLGIVPAGALVVVAIPADAGLVATKFDGIADKVPFELNNGATGTGSNGVEVVLNSVIYKLYGEFKLNDAELFIYID